MRLALFDFDGTLTTRDSLLPFLRHLVGTPAFVRGLVACSGPLLAHATGRMANDVAKERLLARFLAGRSLRDLHAAGAAFATTVLPRLQRAAIQPAFERHRAAGDVCVLVSASLDLYLEPWARSRGFDAVLCSRLAEGADGCVSGRLVPRNCHGPEKARRVARWLAGRRPVHVTAYGDSRGDAEMMALADAAHWVGGKVHRAVAPPRATPPGAAG